MTKWGSRPSRAGGPLTGAVAAAGSEVMLWCADLTLERPVHQTLLDVAERGRRDAFLRDVDRSRFTLAVALLRLAVAAQIGIPPASVHVDRTCPKCGAPHGKPHLPDTGLHASVSHSGQIVAVALTRAAPVGVDVEAVASRDIDGLTQLVLTSAEPVRSPADLFTYWCRKESVVKATGEGLRALRQVVVSPADQPVRLVSYRGEQLTASMSDLAMPAGYAGALTVLAEGPVAVRTGDGTALLRSTGVDI